MMGRRRNLRIACFMLLCFSLSLLSCFSERNATEPVVSEGECRIPLSAIGLNRTVVAIRNFTFFPDTVRVKPGAQVTWVNCETDVADYHTSTSSTGAWSSGALDRSDFYARSFDAPGEFGYFCEPHPFMRGVVIVE